MEGEEESIGGEPVALKSPKYKCVQGSIHLRLLSTPRRSRSLLNNHSYKSILSTIPNTQLGVLRCKFVYSIKKIMMDLAKTVHER